MQLGSVGEPPTLQQLRDFAQSQILTLESIEGGSKFSVILNLRKILPL